VVGAAYLCAGPSEDTEGGAYILQARRRTRARHLHFVTGDATAVPITGQIPARDLTHEHLEYNERQDRGPERNATIGSAAADALLVGLRQELSAAEARMRRSQLKRGPLGQTHKASVTREGDVLYQAEHLQREPVRAAGRH
jgi:hypothetical protein